MTVHRREERLTCHHCGLETAVPSHCPQCAAETRPVGQGTERIEETVARLYPDAPLVRIDRDVVRRRDELEDVLAQADSGSARILIGTQMLTKGHHFPGVTLVVVLNADQGLFSTDFRASERLAQTIVQVAGRAGRAERPGEVLIQTAYPEHPLLTCLLAGGYDAFADAALAERAAAGWPPTTRLALFRAEAHRTDSALDFLGAVRDVCAAQAARDVELLGPAPAPMQRRAGRYRAQLLVRSATPAPLQRVLRRVLPVIEQWPSSRRLRWSIDVDPLELF
jgi:primosomal protein N' (replication factor Y)